MSETRVRSSVVCVHDGKILVFRAVDPQSQLEYLFLPGGKIEETEDARLCAERETLEETGLGVQAILHSEIVKKYIFRWDGQDHCCQTHFFRAELKCDPQKPKPVHDADYNKGVQWLPLSEIDERFKYSRTILVAVKELVAWRGRR